MASLTNDAPECSFVGCERKTASLNPTDPDCTTYVCPVHFLA